MTDQALKLRQLAALQRRKRDMTLASAVGVGDAHAPPEKRMGAASSTRAMRTRRRRARVIAVTSGKGGVGKTVITANLALSFAMSDRRVMLLDADFGLANLDVVLGLSAKTNIRDVVFGEASIGDVIVEGPEGLRLIPAGSGIRALADLTQSQVRSIFDEAVSYDESVDVFLIDTAAGIAAGVAGIILSADEVVIVAEPEPTAVLDAYAVIKTLVSKRRDASVYVVANCVASEEQGLTVFSNLQTVAARFLSKELIYLGSIPEDPRLVEAVRVRRPSLIEFPNSVFSVAIRKLARTLDGLDGKEARLRGGISGFFSRMLDRDVSDA
ncbi:MAG: MinD/ParA family protein [Candidatus Coatesbacteria bacterium]|nr:MinD/ParA family protein [Candidatus Coatesbacteria bacterium]